MSDSGLLVARDNVWYIDSLTARLRPGDGSTVGVPPKNPGALGMAWKTVWPKLKEWLRSCEGAFDVSMEW
jgi:hypothetical protein